MPSRVREAAKQASLFLLSASGAMRAGEYLSSRSLLVLTYHRVVPRTGYANGRRPPNTLFTDEFDRHMEHIAKRYTVLGGDDLRAIFADGSPVPRYAIAITFDDGYENNFTHALPILERHGLHAMFFLTTGLIGCRDRLIWFDRLDRLLAIVSSMEMLEAMNQLDPALEISSSAQIRRCFKGLPHARQTELLDRIEHRFAHRRTLPENATLYGLMSWDQVRAMSSRGMTIGSHTVHHQILAAVPPADAQTEVASSRQRIRSETGQPCWFFAYPNGGRLDFRPSDEVSVRNSRLSRRIHADPGLHRSECVPIRPAPGSGSRCRGYQDLPQSPVRARQGLQEVAVRGPLQSANTLRRCNVT